ncbi:MAG TPA: hypothetical protein PKW80_10430 [Bacteroidales bacterium]|nr:hypothetical protein [Bacteroidales bacterium]
MIKHNYSLYVIFFLLLILNCIHPVYSQDVTADYDENTGILTIEKKCKNIIQIRVQKVIEAVYYSPETAFKTKDFDDIDAYLLEGDDKVLKFKIPQEKIKKGDVLTYYKQEGISFETPTDIEINFIPKTTVAPLIEIQWWMYVAAAGILMLIVLLIYLKLRKKKPVDEKIKPEDNKFEVIEEDDGTPDYTVGLDGVRNDIGNYYVLDARQIYFDTAIHNIFISRAAIKSIYDLFKKFLVNSERTPETGCYIIGRWEYDGYDKTSYNISLEYLVEPGDDVVYGEYDLQFGQKIGVYLGSTLNNISEKTKCNYEHTAWMHSHPGLGLFLSGHDLIVQNQVSVSGAKNRMLAIVIDTNTSDWQTAFFTPKMNGTMNNKDDCKKTFSWEDLYQWSRKPKEENIVTNISSPDNYFELPIKNSTIRSILFSANSINDIDDIIYSSNKGVVGYFSGFSQMADNRRKNIIIEHCLTSANSRVSGCLIAESGLGNSELFIKYNTIIKQYDFFIVYKNDNELYACLNYNIETGAHEEPSLYYFSLEEMKAWIRRKRI